ncbi:peptidase [Haematobacter massiliensis]|uniref:Peptidase n=1 Tax=Haematobacter massiliensis TaxID=195105 RepID=A0A086YBM6_9RHOB|nr:NlpC/P60 family protein [Haematobacter massiliensis]KFI31676.1 peptidase [Haematobacter massiliensis]OWJ72065.1 peptidase [Haematobacter massiliensis]OWJ81568.1 peptidase [Haematobacter massiliensis]QBJ24071.1 peptidase [Haematobacter massiliensis]
MRGDVVAAARLWLGTPYRHQASCRGAGADCLGLIRGVWRDLYGPEPEAAPAYTPDWGETGRQEVLWSAARRHLIPLAPGLPEPGDVLLFRLRTGGIAKHLGIAAETGATPTFIHAYSGHAVVESPLSEPWARRIVARFGYPKGAI